MILKLWGWSIHHGRIKTEHDLAYGGIQGGKKSKWLNFGGDPGHNPALQFLASPGMFQNFD